MKYDWVTSVQNYLSYFDSDSILLINIIGLENYFKLVDHFRGNGIYFCSGDTENDSMKEVKILLGDILYDKIKQHFSKSWVLFRQSSIVALKKAWLNQHKSLHYATATRILGISQRTYYNWRN